MRQLDKPYNNKQWTAARYRSFIMSALRGARWPIKWACIAKQYTRDAVVNGRRVKLHRCPLCQKEVPRGHMQADHIEPVIPISGWDSWDGVVSRMFCEADGFQAICKECHKAITNEQNKQRRDNRTTKKLNQ
jgi:hypothetical protein